MSELTIPVRWTRMVALDQRLYGFPDRIFARFRGKLRTQLSVQSTADDNFREDLTEGLHVCSFVTADRAGPLIFVAGIRPPESLWNWTSAAYWMRLSNDLTDRVRQTPRQHWQPPDSSGAEQGDGLTLARYREFSNEQREVYRLQNLYGCLSGQFVQNQMNDAKGRGAASDLDFPDLAQPEH